MAVVVKNLANYMHCLVIGLIACHAACMQQAMMALPVLLVVVIKRNIVHPIYNRKHLLTASRRGVDVCGPPCIAISQKTSGRLACNVRACVLPKEAIQNRQKKIKNGATNDGDHNETKRRARNNSYSAATSISP
jgi:hypothetical protein